MKKARIAGIAGTTVLAAGLLAGCGGAAETGGTTGGQTADAPSASKPSGPLALTLMMDQSNGLPPDGNEVMKQMEEYTNTKLQITWVPHASYSDKLNIVLASGEMPKGVFVTYVPNVVAAMKDGLFWEIGPYLKNYPNLSKMNPDHFANIAVQGKEYGIPDYRPMGRDGIVYRKDWADELGVQEPPKTLDEWLDVFRKQVKAHPGTYGTVETKELGELPRFVVQQGGYYKWGVENGKLVPDFMGPAYFDVLKFYRTAYKEQLLNPDLATISANDMYDKFYAGKVGWVPAVAGVANGWELNLQKNVPDAKVAVAPVKGPQGIRVPGYSGNNGFFVFPKSSVKTEAELMQILSFFDKLLDPKMANLLHYGIEGTDYKVVDGKAQIINQDHFNNNVKMFTNGLPVDQTGGGNEMPPLRRPLDEAADKIIKENDKYLVKDPTMTLFSQTYADKGADLQQMIHDADIKFITGNIDENGWKSVVEQWKKAGGEQVMAEFTADYAKSKAK
jgi:putative aldouronate transport system substrate-binding protein